jgi:hypothetical protein
MDLADSSGNALICYSASLKLASINLNYNGYTFRSSDSAVVTKRNSFKSTSAVQCAESSIEWAFQNNSSKWEKIDHAIEETLLSNEDGEIRWTCEFPKATGKARLNANAIEGYGYVEKIVITIPPWRIPIKELHWGRFLSKNYTIIWIKWIGPIPKSLLYLNGEKIPNAEIRPVSIVFGDYRLNILNQRTLREGTVRATVFSKFKTIRNLFPKKIMGLNENKWISDGTLSIQQENHTGTIIHEIVVWP